MVETGNSAGTHPPPHPGYDTVVVTVVSCIFPILPLPGQQCLLLDGAEQIRIEETYTPTMMKLAWEVMCDSQFLTYFLLIQVFIVEIYTFLRNARS